MEAEQKSETALRRQRGEPQESSPDLERDWGSTPTSAQSPWRIAWRVLRRNPFAMLALGGMVLVVLVTTLAPWIAPYDPLEFDRQHRFEGPSRIHPFGTDDLGRDILSRVIWGGRPSFGVAALAISLSVGGGTVFGLISGFYGGRVDELIQRLVEIFMAFPTLLLVLTIIAALGPGLVTIFIALGVAGIPGYTRLVRASVLGARNMEYVTAARAVGATNRHIMVRHILPNVLAPIIVFSTLSTGGAIMVTAGLSFLGLGTRPPTADWGTMLATGRNNVYDAWWLTVFPGLAIFFVVICINTLGDGLRDALDPRLRV